MALPPQKPPVRAGALAAQPPAGEDAIAKSRREKDALEGECQKLEEELEALRARYEQYFLGIERKEPIRQREELKKRVLRVKEAFTRNAGLKFRVQALHARYLSYERLWLRSAREKEEGTYRRDLFKARLRAPREEAPPAPGKVPVAKEAEAGAGASTLAEAAAAAASAGAGGAAPAAAGAKAAAAKAPPARPAAPAPLPGAVTEAQLRALYTAYVDAKKRCNEDVSRLTYEAVARSVSKQVPELMTRYKAKAVEFRVDVKDGRAVLKVIPKV